jgi:hypothetical protein
LLSTLLLLAASPWARAADPSAGTPTPDRAALAENAGAENEAVADDEDDEFFKETKPSDQKGANAGVPDSSSFNEDDDIDIPTAPLTPVKVEAERDLSGFDGALSTLGNATRMPVDVTGAKPLADNWSPTIAYTDVASVVVELPVLYAKGKSEFDGVAYWLVAEVYADGKKVAESRVSVTRDAIAEKGPSVHFFRLFSPVPGATGVLEVKVGKATSGAGKPELLFTRSVKYAVGK